MDDNPYGKLAEAFRIFLNPTIELIQQNKDLTKHCYYHLKKYPQLDTKFWSLIEDPDSTWDDIIETSKIIENNKLVHNLTLAKENGDRSYLDYLLNHKPKQKRLQLSLIRKNAIIDLELGKRLGLTEEETKKLTSIHLKLKIHQYIRDHKLQDENLVNLDDTLKQLLEIMQSRIHYFDLLKRFNRKYVQRFDPSNSSNEGSELSV